MGAAVFLGGSLILARLYRFKHIVETESSALGTYMLLTFAAVLLTLAAQGLLLVNVFWSLFSGPKAAAGKG